MRHIFKQIKLKPVEEIYLTLALVLSKSNSKFIFQYSKLTFRRYLGFFISIFYLKTISNNDENRTKIKKILQNCIEINEIEMKNVCNGM